MGEKKIYLTKTRLIEIWNSCEGFIPAKVSKDFKKLCKKLKL